jgi:hypothetical protein
MVYFLTVEDPVELAAGSFNPFCKTISFNPLLYKANPQDLSNFYLSSEELFP